MQVKFPSELTQRPFDPQMSDLVLHSSISEASRGQRQELKQLKQNILLLKNNHWKRIKELAYSQFCFFLHHKVQNINDANKYNDAISTECGQHCPPMVGILKL